MITPYRLCQAALVAALLAAPGLHAAEVAGIQVAEALSAGNTPLLLNGAGLRSKLFIKVYVGALYTERKLGTAQAVYDSPAPRRIVLHLLRDLSADSLQGALDDGLRDNLAPAELAALKPQAEALATLMRGIGQAREGDRIAIDFSAAGVAVALNEQPRGQVAGGDFAKALLLVWLGDKPADASLKKALLGQ